jgi:hypothetical protein
MGDGEMSLTYLDWGALPVLLQVLRVLYKRELAVVDCI